MLIDHRRAQSLLNIHSLPDYSTICRFRNSLLELGLYQKLFEEILRQLEGRGLLVQEGAIVDATVIESSRKQRKAVEIIPEDRKEEETASHGSYGTK